MKRQKKHNIIKYKRGKGLYLKVDPEILRYASLHALNKGIPRSELFRNLITEWYDDVKDRVSEDAIFDSIVYQIYKIWQNKKSKYKNFDEYLDQLERELTIQRSPIDKDSVIRIIRMVDEKNKQD